MAAMVFGFAILLTGLFIAAVLLRAACALYNKLAGAGVPRPPRTGPQEEIPRESETGITQEPPCGPAPDNPDQPDDGDGDRPEGIPELSLGQAMGIVFAAGIVSAFVSFLTDRVLGARMLVNGLWTPSPAASLIALPVSILAIAAMLPTSFGKGLLVALLYTLLALVVGVVLFAIFAVIARVLAG